MGGRRQSPQRSGAQRRADSGSVDQELTEQAFALTLEYDGTDFCGWQSQHNGERTVQHVVQAACAEIFKHPVNVIASGRTDSGVHASGQVVSFRAKTRMKPDQVLKALNARLPDDVSAWACRRVSLDFHAQFHVLKKTYRYQIYNAPVRSALRRRDALFYPYPLNLLRMRRAAAIIKGRHDFRSFQAHDPLRAKRDSVRTIHALVIRKEAHMVRIDITADGFLYKMVRNITGALLAVGSGQYSVQDMGIILRAKDRRRAPPTAAAHGLSLLRVVY